MEQQTTGVPGFPASPGTLEQAQQETLPIGSVEEILARAASPRDTVEEIVSVPEWGCSVRVGTYTAEASAEIKSASIQFDVQGQVASVDIAAMERAQFLHGVIAPRFSERDVKTLQQAPGGAAAWQKVVGAIDRLNGNPAEEVKRAKREFPEAA